MLELGVIPGVVVSGRRNPLHYGLAKRLKSARQDADIAPARLSLDAGLAKDAVFRIEKKRGAPLLDTIERLAQVLNISPCVLAYGIDAPVVDGEGLACALVGERLRHARTALGHGLRELGRAAGVMPTSISNIEGAKGMPSVATIEKLAKALGCDLCWLAYGAGPPPDLAPTA